MPEPVATLVAETQRRLSFTGFLGNGLGGSVLVAFMLFLAPSAFEPGQFDEIRTRSVLVFVVFAAIALPLGWQLIQVRPLAPIERWLAEGRPATDDERTLMLRYPRNWALWSFAVWVAGAVVSFAVNASVDVTAALAGATAIVLGGATACSLQYLLVERIVRPITAVALANGLPGRTGVPGVGSRLAMAWTLATGVPLLGIVAFAVLDLTGSDFDQERIVGAALFLSLLGLSVGLAATLFAARSVAEPLASMREALARVEAGNLDIRVAVDDGSEVGLLQAGFNHMTAGLAERERLREAFGAFVDPSLTERVLREGTDLAGEEVELSLLFMDVRGFTSFSEQAGAREVVARLNDLYGQVVPVVLRNGGHASKFIGDGLLAVFGAPDRLSDHASRAVAAGLQIVELVNRRYAGELRVGVGINSGRVIAGTIGGGGRVDFTVIGDPVNTAARVESATRQTNDDLLITETTRKQLEDDMVWIARRPITLKGKADQVRLYAPPPTV